MKVITRELSIKLNNFISSTYFERSEKKGSERSEGSYKFKNTKQ